MYRKLFNPARITVCVVVFLSVCIVNTEALDERQYNVLLINLTSLRADHLKAYGYSKNTAPNIERFAKEAVIFDQAVAQSNWTLPSLVSILTSRYVHSHGVYDRGQRLSGRERSLAEILKIYGYKTAAFVGGLDTVAAHGLNRGFDCYSDDTGFKPMGSLKEIIPRALKWLGKNRGAKFFLLIQGYDIHPPFEKPKPYEGMYDPGYNGIIEGHQLDYNFLKNIHSGILSLGGKEVKLSERDINHIIACYDSGISYADKFIGELLSKIDELGLLNKTIVIITSEHGEELSDHGSFDRFGQNNLYDEVIRVPLIIRYPGIGLAGKRIISQVQLIDIMPTILELVNIPVNGQAQGLSLVPLFKEGAANGEGRRYAYAEASRRKWAMRSGEWKLIYESGEYELYNLKEDRAETKDVAAQNPKIVYDLTQKLLEWQRGTRIEASPNDNRIELTDEMKRNLQRAGYW